MAGISSKAAGKLENKKNKFQGQEYNDDLGVDMYEFRYRMDDPQTGRFWQVDPLAEKYVYNSTYAFSENKVTSHVELEGLESVPVNTDQNKPARDNTILVNKNVQYPNITSSNKKEPDAAITITISKGKQVGLSLGIVGAELNFGSKEVFKASDVGGESERINPNETKSGASIQVGPVGVSSDISETSTNSTGKVGVLAFPVTTTTTQQTNAFSVGLPKSPFSLGAENTTTTTSQGFGGPITERTQSQMIGGVSRMPSTSGKSSGTTFSVGVYYKAEVKINFMQAITNLFR